MDNDKVSYSFEPEEKGEFTFNKSTEDGGKMAEHKVDSTEIDRSEFDENPLSFLTGKTVSLIIGILVIALLVPFIIFSFSKTKSAKQNTSGTGKGITMNITPTPTAKKTVSKNSNSVGYVGNTTKGGLPLDSSKSQQVVGVKTYTDPVFGYSVNIPSNWEAFKNAGTGNAYQMAFHPIGSTDSPFTIGAQSGISENDWINAEFGTNMPRTSVQVAGKNAISVTTLTYTSYYMHDNTYTYEISEGLGNSAYPPIYNSILSSLKFSK